MSNRPPMIRTDESNAFANNTMRVRVPQLIQDILDLNPDYAPFIQDNLMRLRDDIQSDARIRMLDMPAPDYDYWSIAHTPHADETWHDTVWFFAETFTYRHIIQATRWWETGRDPFARQKSAELKSQMLWALLEEALHVDGTREDRLAELLLRSLWGNRVDLSYNVAGSQGNHATEDDLLADSRESIIRQILSTSRPIHIVADNAGTEFAIDCALINALLNMTSVPIYLHVKMHPTFVSDAIVADVLDFIDLLATGKSPSLGEQLAHALDSGRLRLAPDAYWNSPYPLWELPPRLTQLFETAGLVIFKGDANYRRMLGDAVWQTDIDFATAVDYFPAPLATLRTLKSDPIVGLPTDKAEHLDSIDPDWHISGQRGVIQCRL